MADTPVLKPKWQLILGLLPSLNTCLIAIVTALITFGGTVATQMALSARPPVEKITIAPADPVSKPAAEDKSGAILEELKAIRQELLERLPPKPATPRTRPLK